MFSRPEAKETESDLLHFQEQFIAGRLNPSAAVVRSNTREETRSSCVGGKRDSPCRAQVQRDVVTLEGKFCGFFLNVIKLILKNVNVTNSTAVCFCQYNLSRKWVNIIFSAFKNVCPWYSTCQRAVKEAHKNVLYRANFFETANNKLQ